MKRSYRIGLIVLGITVLSCAGYTAWHITRAHAPASIQTQATTSPLQKDTGQKQTQTGQRSIRLIVSGDELPHEAISKAAKTNTGYDYTPFYKTIKPEFDAADIRFCNQETVSAGESFGVTGYPVFNVSTQFARNLADVGCNVINLANNHMNDKGQAGITETLRAWEAIKPLAFAGVNRSAGEQRAVRYFTVQGIKYAFVAYTEISNTNNFEPYALNMLNEQLVVDQLTEARQSADIVLVSVHWGTEYADTINTAQERWSNRFAALGADVVIGTGPHVLQPVKKLPKSGGGETIVWYSLGNLLSAQLDVPSLIGGFGVMDIDIATKKVSLKGFMPTYMHYEWTSEQKANEDLLARKNFQIYPLAQSAEPLSRSQNNTTIEAQTARVKQLLNQYTSVPIMPTLVR